MKKKKEFPPKDHPLIKEGFEFVPDCTGKIIDSIWKKDDELLIRFAWGPSLRFKPI